MFPTTDAMFPGSFESESMGHLDCFEQAVSIESIIGWDVEANAIGHTGVSGLISPLLEHCIRDEQAPGGDGGGGGGWGPNSQDDVCRVLACSSQDHGCPTLMGMASSRTGRKTITGLSDQIPVPDALERVRSCELQAISYQNRATVRGHTPVHIHVQDEAAELLIPHPSVHSVENSAKFRIRFLASVAPNVSRKARSSGSLEERYLSHRSRSYKGRSRNANPNCLVLPQLWDRMHLIASPPPSCVSANPPNDTHGRNTSIRRIKFTCFLFAFALIEACFALDHDQKLFLVA